MKQTINNGTVAGDGTGEILFDAFEKTNDNFDELYLFNVVHINSPDNFPAAVGGVIELVPNPGDKIVYVIAADMMLMGSDRFTVTDGEVVIRGVHRTASAIGSTTSSPLFTSVNSFLIIEFIVLSNINGKIVDFSAPAPPGLVSFGCTNLIVLNCDSIFNISDSFSTTFRELVVFDSTTAGMLFTGTGNSQLNTSDVLGVSWAGTFLDLGTATFDLLSIGAGNRFLSPSGTTILSGMVNSGNINVGGRALVDNNIFNGIGTALNNITTSDLQWDFENNVFADNTTTNTLNTTDAFLTASTTTTIGTIGLYVAVGGVNWSSSLSSRFTVSTAGLITYTGLGTKVFKIVSAATVEKSGGGADLICTKIAKNGTVADKTTGCTHNSKPTQVTSLGFFSLSTGDTLQLFTGNESSTSNVITSNCSMIVTEL